MRNPETPGLNPDTPENPDIPDINSRYYGFCRTVGVGLFQVVVFVLSLGLFQSYKSYLHWLILYTYV